MDALILQKKAELIKQLLQSVHEYYNATHFGMPMKLLSRRFGKAMLAVGGFNSIVEELRLEGTLEIALNAKTGGKSVYPKGEPLRLELHCVLIK